MIISEKLRRAALIKRQAATLLLIEANKLIEKAKTFLRQAKRLEDRDHDRN